MDLEPFARINPCGYRGLEMVDLAQLGGPATVAQVAVELAPVLQRQFERSASCRADGSY
jgi:lipoyl(octanoyl) transferase